MNVALCLSGQPRYFKECYHNIFKNITLADDLEFNYATNSPTMMVEGMVVGGK